MQRRWIIAPVIFIGLIVYSAVLAESTHQPAPFNSHLPIVYLYSSPTPTPTITPTPQTDLINGNFEQGETGWQWSGFEAQSPIRGFGTEEILGIRPFAGGGAVRLGRDTAETIEQRVIVPLDRPFLIWRWTARRQGSVCSATIGRVGIRGGTDYGIDGCTFNDYGWRQQGINLSNIAGRAVTVFAEGSGEGSFVWVDEFEFVAVFPGGDDQIVSAPPLLPAFRFSVDIYKDRLLLRSTTSSPPFDFWRIRESDGDSFIFPPYELPVSTFAYILPGEGEPSKNTFYWGNKLHLWNDNDCATLFDSDGYIRRQDCD